MDITNILNIGSQPIAQAAAKASTRTEATDESFTSLFNSMLSNVNETNNLLHKEEEEEIKFALGISENTVKAHVRSMLEKTGYQSRTELAIKARVIGITIK